MLDYSGKEQGGFIPKDVGERYSKSVKEQVFLRIPDEVPQGFLFFGTFAQDNNLKVTL